VTITTLDGFGRAVLVQHGDSATPDATTSYTTSVYAPCACSPLGKLQKTSMPYAQGQSASTWTVYSYDGLGRTVSVKTPDGASTTNYNYAGNQTTVTDPAGKWKTTTTDVLGNLTTVLEPDPANQPGGTLSTNYTFDWMGHVTQVSMPRGSTTQTRTFVYNNLGQLTSATNPENGTVSYTYNTSGTLATKTDAKNQQTVYTYDSKNRVTEVQHYPAGATPPNNEDVCQRVTYTYDATQNSLGRLSGVQYYGQNANSNGQGCGQGVYSGYAYDGYGEAYSYTPAGAVTSKIVSIGRIAGSGITSSASLQVDYTYDTAGRTKTVTYPMQFQNDYGGQPVMTVGYDAMGRPSSLTDTSGDPAGAPGYYQQPTNWVSGVQYDYAGRLTGISWLDGPAGNCGGCNTASENRTYNVNGQRGSMSWTGIYGSSLGQIQYVYSATQNNGQITQEIDSGTAITYQYDVLKRLTSASSTGSNQTFQYDGFGNLTAKVLNSTTTPIQVNAGTNQLTYASYDANGNMTSGAGATFTYDESNRVTTAAETSGGQVYYGYDEANKRIYQRGPYATEVFTFYGAKGENLGRYSIYDGYNYAMSVSPQVTNLWFGGRLVVTTNGAVNYLPVLRDRLGTNRETSSSSYPNPSYRPYGEGTQGFDTFQFATYTRDSYTGLDYADQRFYASSYGRFNSADPYTSSGRKNDPGSWNRYAYVGGDPVNRSDPRGTDWCDDVGNCYQGSYPGAPPQCGGIYQTAAFAFNDDYDYSLLENPTFAAQAAAMGCYGASVIPVAAPATPSLTFSVSLYERPVYINRTIPGIGNVTIYVGEHTYIDATAQLSTGAYVNFLCQGGPSGPNGTGNLVGSCQSGYNTMVSAPPSGPGLSANIQVGGTYSCTNCGVVTQLLASVDLYSQSGNLAAYSGTMNGGYNSNSYAFTLLEDIGLAGLTSSGSAWSWFGTPWLAPGWGVTVPGLGP
jgi:RHS repeat-associated protein